MTGGRFFSSFEDLHRQNPAGLALLDADAGETISRQMLMAEVDRVGSLVRRAASPQRIVALQIPNGTRLVAAIFAAWREGLVPLPIDRDRPPSELEHLGQTLGIETVLWGPDATLRGIAGESPGVELPPDVAVLKLTSGSTGASRAVAVTGDALWAGVEQICSTMKIDSGDRNLATLPLAHSYAFDNVVGTLAVLGIPAILLSDLVPRRLAAVVRDAKPTVWPAVPLLVDVLTRSRAVHLRDLESLRLVISAGAPLAISVREAFAERFGLRPRTFYGATECGGIAFDDQGEAGVPEGCVGHPLRGVSIDLLDEEDGIGRIRVRSPSMATKIIPSAAGDPAGGEFRIADLGRIDTEGRLHLLGRVDDFVKIHGHKVFPAEVERVLRAIPGVRDAVVIPYERSSVSEGLRAIVSAEPPIDRKSLVAACERELPSFKVPRSVEIRENLPRNERGKIDRKRL